MLSGRGDRPKVGLSYIAVIPIIGILAIVPLVLPEDLSSLYTDLLSMSGAALCLMLSVYILTIKGAASFRPVGLAFALSMTFYLVAEIIWGYYELVLGEDDAVIPVADIFWISGYIPLIYLCAATVWKHHEHITVRSILVIITGWLVFYTAVIMPFAFYNFSAGENFQDTLIISIYPFLDAMLVLTLAAILVIYRVGELLIYWQFITVGVIMFVLGDMTYDYFVLQDWYRTGTLPDVFFILFYLTIALGLWIIVAQRKLFLKLDPAAACRVSHVFLIYRNGVLISHSMSRHAKRVTDEDILMGMLVSIQDFARESFDDKKQSQLDELKYGNMSYILRRGESVILVAGISGKVTTEVAQSMEETIRIIERKYRTLLNPWNGYAVPLAGTRQYLEELLTD